MATTSTRPVRVSPRISIPLSILMIYASTFTFTGLPDGDGPEWPIFTSVRDPKTMLHIINLRRVQAPKWLFQGAKGIASIAWCVLIPLQHTQSIRRKWPAFHRMVGYIVILLSVDLGLAGLWMLARGMVTTHKNTFHIHTLDPFPLLMWPTFSMTTIVLSIPYFFSLARLFMAIRSRNVELHRRWAVFHSMCGYFIAISRVMTILVTISGWLLVLVPQDLKAKWLRIPVGIEAIIDAEVSALAWTLAAAACVTAYWTYYEWSQAGIIRSRQKAIISDGKKMI